MSFQNWYNRADKALQQEQFMTNEWLFCRLVVTQLLLAIFRRV